MLCRCPNCRRRVCWPACRRWHSRQSVAQGREGPRSTTSASVLRELGGYGQQGGISNSSRSISSLRPRLKTRAMARQSLIAPSTPPPCSLVRRPRRRPLPIHRIWRQGAHEGQEAIQWVLMSGLGVFLSSLLMPNPPNRRARDPLPDPQPPALERICAPASPHAFGGGGNTLFLDVDFDPLNSSLHRPQIVPVVWKHGFFYAICNNKSWTPRLETYYIINYLFKYWELADTMFLVVKKKPLGGSSDDYVARASSPGRKFGGICSPIASAAYRDSAWERG